MRYTGPKCRLCRAEGVKLFLRGQRCGSAKCALTRRSYIPGVHGPNKRSGKLTEYCKQLREKQKAARIYNLTDKKVARYVSEAESKRGVATNEEVLRLLERRFDSIIYKSGLAFSRNQASQLVSHGIFLLNGQRVTTPSIQLKIGDKFEIRQNRKNLVLFSHLAKTKMKVPSYLKVDLKNISGELLRMPEKKDMEDVFDVSAIIEFYSR